MTHTRSFFGIIAACSILLAVLPAMAQQPKTTTATEKQSAANAANYPEKLVHDFPSIYTDTAYISEDYNVVVRAVWMTQRGRKTKVTSPDQLPEVSNCDCVRFASFNAVHCSSAGDFSSTTSEVEHTATEF